jgi:hypothetical protein
MFDLRLIHSSAFINSCRQQSINVSFSQLAVDSELADAAPRTISQIAPVIGVISVLLGSFALL